MTIRARLTFGALVTLSTGAALFAACSSPTDKAAISYCGPDSDPFVECTPNGAGTGATGNIPTGLGVGEDCSGNKSDDCRPGLACVSDECEPAGLLTAGSPCVIGAECADGLTCLLGTCAPAGDGAAGDACKTDADCEAGLRCGINGLSASCVPAGTTDLGGMCVTQNDCYQGLYCKDGACSLPEPPLGIPLWDGVECEEVDEDAPVRAYFEVPGAAGAAEGDFFRLPFPNDIRLNGNKPVLTGFPTPGPELLGVDIVQNYVDKLEAEGDKWSSNGSIIFRFSGPVDFSSLKFENGKRPLVMVDLTQREGQSPDDHVEPIGRLGVGWNAGGGRTNYVCENWIAARPGVGGVLKPNHTYAVWITTDAKDEKGNAIERSPNFEPMLGNTAPSDPKLAAAYAKYAPLRQYLAEYYADGVAKPIDPDTIVNATVFTVGDTIKPMRDLAAAVAAAPAPTASGWVKCAEGVESPCGQASADEGRACGTGTADFDEYQALVSLPVFQKGEAPYLTSGGGIDDAPVRTEEVCASLSVPKGAAPGGGYPLVIYAHGTGGSFRSHLSGNVAGELASATPKFAVLGIDQVEHGPRRGASTEDPDNLFFNFVNPDAARGNPMQGAADQLALLRLAKSLGTVTVGADSFTISSSTIVFYGHSQGSTHGSLMLPYSDFPGAVLSGNGGSLVNALVAKTNPVNIAGALPIVLQDVNSQGELAMGVSHPALTLLQQWIDPADPLTFAPLNLVRPDTGRTPKDTFETFGLDDTYSPPLTLAAYTYAAGLDLVTPPSGVNPTGDNKLSLTASSPVAGNYTTTSPAGTFTGAVRQYAPPAGTDGHFVATDVEQARADIVKFITTTASGTPSLP